MNWLMKWYVRLFIRKPVDVDAELKKVSIWADKELAKEERSRRLWSKYVR